MKAGSDRKRTELFDVIYVLDVVVDVYVVFLTTPRNTSNVLICISIPARHPAQS